MQNNNLSWTLAVAIFGLAGWILLRAWRRLRRPGRATDDAGFDSNTLLHSALDITQAGAWRIDLSSDSQRLELSESAQRIYGCSDDAGGWSVPQWLAHVPPQAANPTLEQSLREQLAHMRKRKGAAYDVSYPFQRPSDGRQVWLRDCGRIRLDAQGKPAELLGLVVDITESRRLQEEMYRSNSALQQTMEITASSTVITRGVSKDKEYELQLLHAKDAAESAVQTQRAFLANMSHEVRTPLNAIIGLSGLALKGTTDANQQDYLKKIAQSGQDLLGTLTDILDFSKMEAGKLSIECKPFDLHTVLDTVSQTVRAKASQKDLHLVCSFDPALPRALVGDPLRIGQILSHFANNAVKFTATGDIHMAISLRDAAAHHVDIRITVSDTGIGLTQDQISHLFKGFSQADSSATRAYGGNGLGLAICKRLAEAMGGDVGVASEYGSGSTFSVDLRLGIATPEQALGLPAKWPGVASVQAPLSDADADAQATAHGLKQLWGARLLLVDDSRPDPRVQGGRLRSYS